jgi:hypothetical protein
LGGGGPLRLDALRLEALKRLGHPVDRDGDVGVAGSALVAAPVVIEGQLKLLVLARHPEEVVSCFALSVSHDVHIAAELEPQRLVKSSTLLRIRNPVHRVEKAAYMPESRQ